MDFFIKISILFFVFLVIRGLQRAGKSRSILSRLNRMGKITSDQKDNTSMILHECWRAGCDEWQAAYIVATAWHESRLRPVRECFAKTDDEARRCVSGRDYGQAINGQVFYGRGFPQLTWFSNYLQAEEWADIPGLAKNPDLALEAGNSAKILVRGMMEGRFTGAALPTYIKEEDGHNDAVNARRTVNGLDRAVLVADYQRKLITP